MYTGQRGPLEEFLLRVMSRISRWALGSGLGNPARKRLDSRLIGRCDGTK